MSGSNGVATTLPALNPATVVQVEKLALVIDEFIEADAADLEHREVIAGLRAELRGVVTDEAWEVFLGLDHAREARLRDLSVALVAWGFTEGLRYGGGGRSGGGR